MTVVIPARVVYQPLTHREKAMTDRIITSKDNNPPDDLESLFVNLSERNKPLLDRAKQLIEAAREFPDRIETDDMAGRFVEFIKTAHACSKSLETARKGEKEPFITAGKNVDKFFEMVASKIESVMALAKVPLDRYTKEKLAAEQAAQAALALAKRQESEAMAAAAAAMAKVSEDLADAPLQEAVKIEKQAAKMEDASKSNTLSMPVRATNGASASLRTTWEVEITSIEDLDLEKLRLYFTPSALDQAARAYVRAGGRDLKGAVISQVQQTVVR